MEPGVFFPPAILRSEIKGRCLNGIVRFPEGMRGAEEGATRRVRQVHRAERIDDFRLLFDNCKTGYFQSSISNLKSSIRRVAPLHEAFQRVKFRQAELIVEPRRLAIALFRALPKFAAIDTAGKH